ncbi:MAG: glutathione S-transferase C-terminal domain-containing protein [Ancrocorticia sp.]|uniref:glutathione S-transferase C-terminal domain-containing protein n=1 Tax=Ancrocorticia sp. TaxID=2593684 RepID=UPI003F90DC36
MTALKASVEYELLNPPARDDSAKMPEVVSEQTPDGGFRRQRNWFTARFGQEDGQWPVEAGRYRLLGSVGCGWARRQLIVTRLLGLQEALPFVLLYGRDSQGWRISDSDGDVVQRFGTDRLNDFYRATDPTFAGRGTSPTVIDTVTGKVVTNNYHLLPIDLETAWKPLHKADAPDLYQADLRQEIDLLNQQLFDDVNNGTYKAIFAQSHNAALAAKRIFEARLADYNFRLASRRYLFGDRLTDSDVRLFQTLASFERNYRPGFVELFGQDDSIQISDYPNLWAYARDLFQNGLVDDREKYFLGLVPGPSGEYINKGVIRGETSYLPTPEESLAAWLEPAGREGLTGSPLYTGPGGGGSYELWSFGA